MLSEHHASARQKNLFQVLFVVLGSGLLVVRSGIGNAQTVSIAAITVALLAGSALFMAGNNMFNYCEQLGSLEVQIFNFGRRVLTRAMRRIRMFEDAFMKMKKICTILNQLIFFLLCERLLLTTNAVSSLYTLMFFTVVTYCVGYVKELVERADWNMVITVGNVRHLALTTTYIVLEWTKAITFIITVIFMLLVFSLEKVLKDYSPTVPFLVITFLYYMTIEKMYVEIFSNWFDKRKFDYFEGLESLYTPVIILGIQIFLSGILTLLNISPYKIRILILALFFNIRLKYRELSDDHITPLQKELSVLSKYRQASFTELAHHDDVCAICLYFMSSARVTPCFHYFHADCLRQCLRESNKCPICQYNISGYL
ncbi:unnamed protein product [Meganyctiphanes norvegica]|uniref:RING-type domain-containing protein n=1 Tax=Meganyctiphanes norvegica TaxID=48144 RepID=A0AAV2PM58_MEGNR